MVAQELLERGHKTCVACCKDILENVPANAILITSDEAHFIYLIFSKTKFLLLVKK